ncbi:hypothetical protein BJY04DRAFT_189873 [Aspergillus karnatakaensis]|uniref:uncharacterized protein n=1 Tax=Aspergillus karnatakaensis TaxID=1810916 RepID=UPI003CCD3782
MPSRTPLRALPRQNARPQFASTPRFLLSQRAVTQRVETGNSDSISGEDGPDLFESPNSRPPSTAVRDSTSRRKEVIEDPSSDLLEQEHHQQQPGNDISSDEIPSSPPPELADMDAEIDELFGPTRRHSKRRRISVNLSTPVPVVQKRRQHDFIQTSSPERPSLPLPSTAEPLSPSLPIRTTPQKSPRPPATPGIAKLSIIRNQPRFLISSASQSKPKPTFVLPRSPSPDQTDDANAIPAPFSPSSRALRRRGRQRSSAPGYLPGGMASEVRGWILEMGTKREQIMQSTAAATRVSRDAAGAEAETDEAAVNAQRYSFMLTIRNVRQTALGSCGALAFVQGHDSPFSRQSESADEDSLPKSRNVLLLGSPRLRPGELRTSSVRPPELKEGDVVGVFKGLVWEVGQEDETGPGLDHEQILRRESQRGPGLGRWFVGMEWEVVSSA